MASNQTTPAPERIIVTCDGCWGRGCDKCGGKGHVVGTPQSQTTPDIVDRLRRLSSGRTYPATPEMQFHGVVEGAIAEIERLRAEVHALQEQVERVEEERNELARRYTHG